MNKPFSLQPLMNLARHQNESATLNLGQLNQRQLGAQQKLDALQAFRKDYQARLQAASLSGMDQAELRNFQQFINTLEAAINLQLKAVGLSQTLVQAGRSEYHTAQRKLKSFDTLQQRHLATQNQIAAKSEQKTLDEHTGRLFSSKLLDSENTNADAAEI